MEAFPTLDDKAELLALLARIEGSLSLFSICFIFILYAFVTRLRTELNTFLVLTSVGSMLGCIACIVSSDGFRQGVSSPVCLAQSFLLDV